MSDSAHPLTHDDIAALCERCGRAGDALMVHYCKLALMGDEMARHTCELALMEEYGHALEAPTSQ